MWRHSPRSTSSTGTSCSARGRVLPGAREVLAALAAEPGVVQSVLSGNLRAVSATKLSTFGLDRYLDLEVGAYGDDDRDRPALVAIAQSRAKQKYGTTFTPDNTVIIGDSTHDIDAGQQGGARSIGIDSGSSSVEELKQTGATAVWRSLDAIKQSGGPVAVRPEFLYELQGRPHARGPGANDRPDEIAAGRGGRYVGLALFGGASRSPYFWMLSSPKLAMELGSDACPDHSSTAATSRSPPATVICSPVDRATVMLTPPATSTIR